MNWRLLVFDWDGTLMDSAAHIIHAVCAAAEDAGLGIPAEEQVRHVIGLSLPKAFEAVLPDADEGAYVRFVEAYRKRFWQASIHGHALFPGARDVLLELKQAGYLLAVATGKGKHGLRRALENDDLLEVFDVTRCSEETTSKPDPHMLREILEDLSLSARDALMIGDTSYDMEMAARIGMDRLAVSYGVHGRDLLHPHAPLGYLEDIRALPKWLTEGVIQGSASPASRSN